MNPELQRAAELAAEYIESFDSQRVSQEPDPQALKARLHEKLTAASAALPVLRSCSAVHPCCG